jgi:DNA-binding IclR family transcriptional regulator
MSPSSPRDTRGPLVVPAYLPADERERILARGGFERFTDFTAIDPDRIRETLGDIRSAGYHVGVRDLDADALGVGAPIFDDTNQIAAAISVAAPAVRIPHADLARTVELVREAASAISRQLGHANGGGVSESTDVRHRIDRSAPPTFSI